ncbi:glycosyltransferase family 4 protein [Vaginisenegalia massiliensis]|uniref:glycosyltransferase family 4 protein n=1 Tax=Vaginisenegalia massiliensis TaxID=2058294 RepID=UPI000F51C821|nr:glycosyltransferase family 4 protein [Vaginisenegalia massiliensis]
MNIGFFTDTYFPQVSGVSTSVKILRDELERRGHKVIIFTTTDPDAEVEEGIVRLPSIPFISFEDRRIAYAGFDRCLRIAKKYKLDIVHTHTEFSLGLAGKFVASRMKIPTIHTYHTMYENYTHYIWNGHLISANQVKVLSRLYCGQTSGIISPSRITYDKLKDYGVKTPMQIIPTGVEMPQYDPDLCQSMRNKFGFSDQDRVLLSLSRLSKEKQIDRVIDIFPQVKAAIPGAKLVIVGDGPAREELEQQAKTIAPDIQFVGQIDHEHVAAYYQMADLYVNASESESQGLTYLEAFANRLPIIAKANPYLESVMLNANFGALFDHQEAFAQTVIDFIQAADNKAFEPIQQDDLYALSSEYFGEQVELFYQQVIQNYNKADSKIFDRFYGGVKEIIRDIVIGGDKID